MSRAEADTPSKQDATTTASPDASALAVLMQWSGPSGNTASPTAGTTDSADQTQVAVTASGKSSLPALGTMQDLPTSAQDSSGTGSGDTGHLASTLQTSTTIPAVDQGQIAPHTSQASQAMTADTQAATTDFAARLAASPQEDGKSASGMDASLASIQAATQVTSQGGAGTSPAAPVATTSAASTVTVQMDSPAFASQLSQHIGALVKQDLQQARIQVSPQGMGPIDIKLQVSNGVVDVNFAVQHPATVHAIQQTLPQLDSLMSAQGLQLGQAQVGQQSAGQTYGQDASDQPSNDRSPGTMAVDAGTAEASTPVMLIQRTGRSLIDHFV
ncbi:flagellar hook-length control protein FliK [Frateuria aurantia]|uniref:flagellar hook-length control protein FliK n=1 Tax=Frateuria aurantia TaxID=81475 RepID=UPI00145CCF24|nr:flagellar hook-length control protein FliK [Frateuria aurantia]